MPTIAETEYALSEIGLPRDLCRAGTSLENPFVYDSTARELRAMAAIGKVEILSESTIHDSHQELITAVTFRRVR